jgi:O-acetyl-ADP-ribose deacetylase (regulator of RNase III)
MRYIVKGATIRLVQGDITEQATDAIVNAANSSLMGGGGVDGAIHRRGGPKILEECREIRARQWPSGLPAGNAVITSGGELKAKFVIHTVGPVWRGGSFGEKEVLRSCYWNSLNLAVERGIKTIAFPSISTGAYGYPIEEASEVALSTIKDFLEKHNVLEEVVFVLFSARDFKIYKEAADRLITS